MKAKPAASSVVVVLKRAATAKPMLVEGPADPGGEGGHAVTEALGHGGEVDPYAVGHHRHGVGLERIAAVVAAVSGKAGGRRHLVA